MGSDLEGVEIVVVPFSLLQRKLLGLTTGQRCARYRRLEPEMSTAQVLVVGKDVL